MILKAYTEFSDRLPVEHLNGITHKTIIYFLWQEVKSYFIPASFKRYLNGIQTNAFLTIVLLKNILVFLSLITITVFVYQNVEKAPFALSHLRACLNFIQKHPYCSKFDHLFS